MCRSINYYVTELVHYSANLYVTQKLIHLIYVLVFLEGVPVDGDDPAHVQWIFEKAKERAHSFNIQGVTYRLTQG